MSNNSENNEISDEGIIHLHDFPGLKNLNLCNNRITEAGIQNLGKVKFPYLECLDLSSTGSILGENGVGNKL